MLAMNREAFKIELERERRRRLATKASKHKRDFIKWARTHFSVMLTAPSAAFHHEIGDLLLQHNHLALAAPRGHAKSAVVTFAYALFAAAFKKAKYILVISDSADQARERLGDIYDELASNDDFVKLYPHLRLPNPTDYKKKQVKRSVGQIITVGGVTFRAAGSGQSLRGARKKEARPDLIICDDLENEASVATPEQRDKMRHWFNGTVMGLGGAQKTQIVVVGTVLHRHSFLNNLLKDAAEGKETGWVTRKWRAWNEETGELLWPEYFTREHLEGLQKRMGEAHFRQEYLNEPVSDQQTLFKGAWFYDELPTGGYREVIGFDGAFSKKETADYTAIVWMRTYDNETFYITKVVRDRFAPEELEPLFALHNIQRLSWHVGGGEQATARLLEKYVQHGIVINAIRANADKRGRAYPLSTAWNAGKVLLPREAPWLNEVLSEVDEFTGVGDKHDDQVDAMASAFSELTTIPEAEGESYW